MISQNVITIPYYINGLQLYHNLEILKIVCLNFGKFKKQK
jgi:hypothetical protein